ncbi:MAG: ABC transporter ATP-binding protein [Akkermansia sp.]
MSECVIRVLQLRRSFGTLRALDGVSFEVAAGQSVGLIGANGAGKTTLMRLLTMVDAPDSGRVELFGTDVLRHPERVRARVGWMPDACALPPRTSVREYIDFFARAVGLTGARRLAEVERVLSFCGIEELANRQVNKLSKGQAQRLSLARMLVGDPQLLVLDEPAAGLDPVARVELRHYVNTLREQGKTLLISSHILTELAEMCDHLLLLEAGKLVYHGRAEDLMPPSGGTPVRLRTAGDAALLLLHLEQQESWAQLRRSGNTVQGIFAGVGDEALAAELQRLATLFPLCGFAEEKPVLEQGFIKLMSHKS